MNSRLKQRVRRRASGYCEYCLVHQDFDFTPHHVDHIIALKHRGSDDEGNLCFACASCSLAKGPNISGSDLRSGTIVRLFHPRTDVWIKHFRWDGPVLIGRTPIGRVTVAVLNINGPDRVALRALLIDQGQFPPAVGTSAE